MVSGYYPGGHKRFQFDFPRQQFVLQKECTGFFEWDLSVMKSPRSDLFLVSLTCSLSFPSWEDIDWTADIDLIVRILHPDSSKTNLAQRGARKFSKTNKKHNTFFDKVPEEFWKDQVLTVEVEIGIKSRSENILKSFMDSKDLLVMDIDCEKFYLPRSILAEKSPVLDSLDEKMRKGGHSILDVCETDPVLFKVFIDIIIGKSPTLRFEQIKDLLRLADLYKVADVKKECEKYLMERTDDVEGTIKVAEKYNLFTVLNHHVGKITDVTKKVDLWTSEKLYEIV